MRRLFSSPLLLGLVAASFRDVAAGLSVNDKWHSLLWKLCALLLWTLPSRSQAVTSHCFCFSAVGMLWERLPAPFLALLKSCFAALWVLASLRFLFYFWAWRSKSMHILFSFMRPLWTGVWLFGMQVFCFNHLMKIFVVPLRTIESFFLVQITYFRVLAF